MHTITLEKSNVTSEKNADLSIPTNIPVHIPIRIDKQNHASKHIQKPCVCLNKKAIVVIRGLTMATMPPIVRELPTMVVINQITPPFDLFFCNRIEKKIKQQTNDYC